MASRQWNAGGFLRQPRRADDFPAPGPSFPARFRRARRERKRRGASVARAHITRALARRPRWRAPPQQHLAGDATPGMAAEPALPWAGAAGDPGLAPYLRACTA